MTGKVLVAEDDRDIADLVRHHLEREGFRCVLATDGVAAVRLARQEQPDLVILDLMLPELDGFEVCRQLRADPLTARVPVVMLTARGGEVDRVVGLELGADDYVVKPFSPRELVARVRAVLRRVQASDGPRVLRVGDVELDEGRHQVAVGGRPVELTPREFALLQALVRAAGRVLSREDLLAQAWRYPRAGELETRTVDVHIHRLREKLGHEGRRIVTVKGVGYRLEPEG